MEYVLGLLFVLFIAYALSVGLVPDKKELTKEEEVRLNIAYWIEKAETAMDLSDWDGTRLALQKVAYSMIHDFISQEEKDNFKRLVAQFAKKDPLYHSIMALLKPVIRDNQGIMQSKIYVHAPDHTPETIRYVLYYANEIGDIKRIKKGRSYQLLCLD